jgi:superfamily II DNA or RNA helicase
MLRSAESPIIFVQQPGRGLRKIGEDPILIFKSKGETKVGPKRKLMMIILFMKVYLLLHL